VVVCNVHASTWTEAGAWWETGVPEALSGRAAYNEGKERQLRWLRGQACGLLPDLPPGSWPSRNLLSPAR
jgi:hypothetical protein